MGSFTINPTATITDKQADLIAKLTGEKDWSLAPTEVSITIKKVSRAFKIVNDDERRAALDQVKRLAASKAIDFMLSTGKAPTAATAAPAATGISKWHQLSVLLAQLPVSKYAVWSNSGEYWTFVEVREQKTTNKRYLNKLLGAPGHWNWASGLSVEWMISMAQTLLASPTQCAVNYCEQFTRCSACDSPLSNAKSIAEAMGPVCRKKFKW